MYICLSLLQAKGVEKILPIGEISSFEEGLVAAAVPELKSNIEKVGLRYSYLFYLTKHINPQGVSFVNAPKL